MSWGILPKPGTSLGPCEDDWGHRDCSQTREMAQSKCTICGEPIGYSLKFTKAHNGEGLVHLACTLAVIEKTRGK